MNQLLNTEKTMDNTVQLKADAHLAKQGYMPNWVLTHPTMTGLRVIHHKPHMPCYQLCSYINRPEKMWRPHISCLFCPQRRFHYGKLNRGHWTLLRKQPPYTTRIYVLAVAPKRGSFLTKNYQVYFALLNAHGRFAKFRDATIRCLLRICEWVNWVSTSPTVFIPGEKLKKLMFLDMEASTYGTILPRQYKAYFIIYEHNPYRKKVRNFLVRPLTTLCELIGQL